MKMNERLVSGLVSEFQKPIEDGGMEGMKSGGMLMSALGTDVEISRNSR